MELQLWYHKREENNTPEHTMAYYNLYLLASTYGSGNYDGGTYNNATASSGGSLSDTGIAVISIVTIAAVILLAAMAVRIWKRPSKRVAETVESDDDTTTR